MTEALTPVQLKPPELLIKAVSDGLRVGVQLAHVAGVNKPLAGLSAWWLGSRRMWVLEASNAVGLTDALGSVFAGQHVDLDDVPALLNTAMAAPCADYFTQLLDVQIFPLVKVFIGTTSAAGVGITLTAANLVTFASLPWTPAMMRQAEDRAYRLGQKRDVLVLVPIIPGTIDEGVLRLQESKRTTEEEVVEAVKTSLHQGFNTKENVA